jgi:amino acid permease
VVYTNAEPKSPTCIVGFGWAAVMIVLVLAFVQTRSGSVQDVGFVVGLPVILVLLVIAPRIFRSSGQRSGWFESKWKRHDRW